MTKIRVSITIDRNVWLAMKQRYGNVSGTIERLVVEDMGLRSEYVVSEKICVHDWVSLGETKDICNLCGKIRKGHWTKDKEGKLKKFIVDSIQ